MCTFLCVFLIGITNSLAQNFHLKNFSQKDGLPSLHIQNCTQDNTGYLWIATNKGLVQYDGSDFTIYTTKNGLISNNVNVISTKNNTVFIGTNKGLSIKSYTGFKNFESSNVNCILTVKDHTFLGTNKGIVRVREGYLSPIRTNFQIDLNQVNDIQFDGSFYWITTNKSLWKLDKLISPTVLKRIDLDNYTSILINNKTVIATTYDNGIKLITEGAIETLTTTVQNIKGIKKINNQFWVISKDEGIEVLDDSFSFERTINKYNSLTTNQITSIFQDTDKNTWISTENNGLYLIKNDKPIQRKPTISFENISVVYQTLDSININNYPKTLQLQPNKNHISFYYKTVDINNPNKIEYRYKLNNQASPWTTKNSVDLAYLTPGNYTFSAQSRVGKSESTPIEFNFFIDTPLYKKKWFIWSSVALTCLILSLFIWLYIRRIQTKNKAKVAKLQLENHLLALEQKALQLQMNPHFIFNVLNGIKALGNSGNSVELNSTISKFATLLRGILHNSRQEEISLAEEINTLKNYIELEQQMNSNIFEYTISTNLTIASEEILIPPMLIQPFVENSIKHGISSVKNGKIDINFSIKNDFLHCKILDNGIGIHQSKKLKKTSTHQSIALSVTQERIQNLSKESTFSISEIYKNNEVTGTKILFKIPLKTDF
ncbi:sensor histidine kinase [Tenacibaculum caenipelagi]|uniref:Two component regulator with propeller domain n=1 Tax=Tenacibaculum caenipelagi TaxID=1325435 RepID=A0A4R6THI8_9FLAO|nr:histidine kinase [Tenacibaculum caenipelagi]TDQ29935.1 two component regulator with propeller domain [Tenacibaculum caenipelagi]